jgi:AcrR family transcriptional regulator
MNKDKKTPWIEVGYQMVADSGFGSISIESISRQVGKNKSSFYHHFGDTEVFKDELLTYHLLRAEQFAKEVDVCESINPGMINVFLLYKSDFFFHKQLRIERTNPEYKRCFEKVFELYETAVLEKWAVFLKLHNQQQLASTFLRLISENFLLQITQNSYTFYWLSNYLDEVAIMLSQLKPNLSA